MLTTFFSFLYILVSLVVILLLSIAIEGNSNTGYAWLFGIFVIPVSILFGVVMIACSLSERNYPTGLIFEWIGLLVLFIVITPLSSFIILTIKDVHENERYGIPFIVCGFVSFIPAILKTILLIQESTESQLPTIKTAFIVSAAVYGLTMIAIAFVPNE